MIAFEGVSKRSGDGTLVLLGPDLTLVLFGPDLQVAEGDGEGVQSLGGNAAGDERRRDRRRGQEVVIHAGGFGLNPGRSAVDEGGDEPEDHRSDHELVGHPPRIRATNRANRPGSGESEPSGIWSGNSRATVRRTSLAVGLISTSEPIWTVGTLPTVIVPSIRTEPATRSHVHAWGRR